MRERGKGSDSLLDSGEPEYSFKTVIWLSYIRRNAHIKSTLAQQSMCICHWGISARVLAGLNRGIFSDTSVKKLLYLYDIGLNYNRNTYGSYT